MRKYFAFAVVAFALAAFILAPTIVAAASEANSCERFCAAAAINAQNTPRATIANTKNYYFYTTANLGAAHERAVLEVKSYIDTLKTAPVAWGSYSVIKPTYVDATRPEVANAHRGHLNYRV